MQGVSWYLVVTDEKSSNSQRVYRMTKDQILSGEFRGGQLLSEVEVATQLGVSRTPVHEAFLRLAAEDFLDLVPRRGAVVVPVSAQEATDLLEMRLALETAAVRRLCRSSDSIDTLFGELTELVERQRHGAAIGDADEFAAADDAFHRRIVQVAGNSIAGRFYGSLSDRQRRMMADAARSDSARLTELIGEHADLADAIGRRDVAGFEAALLAHLEATYRVVLA
ncbi:GntR family transcriptional regulator [Mycolicibacterium houstonense]|uniref:GntR family transcriptional regulator n=1 Tax=Mycolicibacterium houstonense TaxID=146021 RepID=UPI00082DEBDD|nr:GntR family transcriptional regulator [Mycolicibacterium houstonense]